MFSFVFFFLILKTKNKKFNVILITLCLLAYKLLHFHYKKYVVEIDLLTFCIIEYAVEFTFGYQQFIVKDISFSFTRIHFYVMYFFFYRNLHFCVKNEIVHLSNFAVSNIIFYSFRIVRQIWPSPRSANSAFASIILSWPTFERAKLRFYLSAKVKNLV